MVDTCAEYAMNFMKRQILQNDEPGSPGSPAANRSSLIEIPDTSVCAEQGELCPCFQLSTVPLQFLALGLTPLESELK